MKLKTKSVKLTEEGRSVVVCEADATYDARFSQTVKDAEACEDQDKGFLFFYKSFYPILSACILGDVPGAKDVYALDPHIWDEWYLAVWELNTDLLGPVEVARSEEIVFRDKSKIVVHASRGLPSFFMRLVQLEYEAQEKQDVPADQVNFRNYIYPKIAACVNGSKIPTADEIVSWPRVEIARWSSVAMKLNPNWFQLIYDTANSEQATKEQVKKKRSRRVHRKPAESSPLK